MQLLKREYVSNKKGSQYRKFRKRKKFCVDILIRIYRHN